MGQVYLEPMRKELSLTRASVSTIFGILPAVTLGAGQLLLLCKKSCFLKLGF
jgi:hypothetical protein